MIRVDEYGRATTQLGQIAGEFKVEDTRNIHVMKISDAYKQKLLATGLRVKLYHYDRAENTYWLPPAVGKKILKGDYKIDFTMKYEDLLPLQQDTIKEIRLDGNRSAFIESDTGTGKSYILAGLIATYKVKTLIVVPNISIARWLLEKISKRSKSVYLAQGKKILDVDDDIVICHHTTFNTHYKALNWKYESLIIDECFIAGTKVDWKNIEDIKIWDYVRSFNHTTNKVEYKKVLRCFKNKTKILTKIETQWRTIICTPEHPFRNWLDYTTQKNTDIMLYIINKPYEIQMQSMLKRVWRNIKMKTLSLQENLKNILFNWMLKKILWKYFKNHNGRNKSQICLSKNENKQSHVETMNQRENENHTKVDLTQTDSTGWQLKALSNPPTINGIGIRTAARSCGNYWMKMKLISYMLQNRYSKWGIKDMNWGWLMKPFSIGEKNTGQKKDWVFRTERVEDIKIYQQWGSNWFEQMCPDGYVYNIEVEDNNNYFVEDVLVHNCHHLPTKRIEQICKWKGGLIYWLSATPIRKEFGREWVEKIFGKIYNTGLTSLPVKVLIHKFRYDYDAQELEEASDWLAPDSNEIFRRLVINNEKRYTELLKILDKLDAEWYTKYIVFSDRVEHLETIIELLKENWRNPIWYYWASNKAESETKIKSSDKYVIVWHPTSCGEGFDVPELEVSILFTSTGREWAVRQMAWRAKRFSGEKKEWILVDFVDQLSIMGGKIKSLSFSNRMKIYKELGWETNAL